MKIATCICLQAIRKTKRNLQDDYTPQGLNINQNVNASCAIQGY
jgi:hypothetical protein